MSLQTAVGKSVDRSFRRSSGPGLPRITSQARTVAFPRPTRSCYWSSRTQCSASVGTSIVDVGTKPSSTEVAHLRNGPIVSTFDMTLDAHDALLWTAHNLCLSGDRMVLVHVVCDARQLHTVIATGASSTGWVSWVDSKDDMAMESLTEEVQHYTDRLVAKARASLDASDACQEMAGSGIQYEVLLPQLPVPQSAAVIGETLLTTASQAGGRLLVLANHGPGVLADFGSVVRYCYQHSTLPLLLIPHIEGTVAVGTEPTAQDVVLIVDSAHEVQEHHRWVTANLCVKGECIQVWHTGVGPFDIPDEVVEDMAEGRVSLACGGSVASMFEEQPKELGEKVCQMLDSPHIKAVAIVNTCRKQGLVREGLCGSLSSYLSRHCSKPLLLLQPADLS